uniref:Uncharacterized protein n=1 Tax=Anguilla anguilla TaxID=7936 RepID=A0A0E9SQM6_ANGAN
MSNHFGDYMFISQTEVIHSDNGRYPRV